MANKEERIELLRRQASRRILNRDISEAFCAWLELWEAKTYALDKLRQVGEHERRSTPVAYML